MSIYVDNLKNMLKKLINCNVCNFIHGWGCKKKEKDIKLFLKLFFINNIYMDKKLNNPN